MNDMADLAVRQLDEALKPFAPLRGPAPTKGWARAIRETLGLSLRQMARRTGVSPTSIRSAEAGEEKGTVQMDTLRKLADGLECDLVYALVPRNSLSDMLRAQAGRKAAALVGPVAESMEMEAQGVDYQETQRQAAELAATLLRERGRDFWDV